MENPSIPQEDRAAGIRLLNRMERIGAPPLFVFESTGDELSIYADVLEKIWQKEIENQVKKKLKGPEHYRYYTLKDVLKKIGKYKNMRLLTENEALRLRKAYKDQPKGSENVMVVPWGGGRKTRNNFFST